MKWRAERPKKDLTDWHVVFLWKPIRQGEYKYWLCFMHRRQVVDRLGLINENKQPVWEYQEPDYV